MNTKRKVVHRRTGNLVNWVVILSLVVPASPVISITACQVG